MWQGIDQRQFPRAKYKCTVILQQKGESSNLPSVTENIGLGGICVLLAQALDVFSPVDLEINFEDGSPPLRISGTIVWVVKRRDLRKGSSFDTGIEFAELKPQTRARIEAVIDTQTTK